MGRTFSAVPYTYLKRGVYYFVTLTFFILLPTPADSCSFNCKKASKAKPAEVVTYDFNLWPKYRYPASHESDLRVLESAPIEVSYIADQIRDTGLVSFLLYENGKIVLDYMSSDSDKYALVGPGPMNNETRLISNSLGKSFVSFLMGHAICRGVIQGVDATIEDWPLVSETLYSKVSIIDLLNMRAGDSDVMAWDPIIDDQVLKGTGVRPSVVNLDSIMASTAVKGKSSGRKTYNYNGLITRLLVYYLVFKMGDEYESFVTDVLNQFVGNQHDVFMLKTIGKKEFGTARYTTYMTRYDYLRFSLASLESWDSESCIGRYLTEIYSRRTPKPKTDSNFRPAMAKSYGGQFHFDYKGLEDRRIVGLDGYGGQAILIDLDTRKIAVANAMESDYDWHKVVLSHFKK